VTHSIAEIYLRQGIEHQRAGRLSQAAALYQQILIDHPNHAEAFHLLGTIALQTGDLDAAARLIQIAINLDSTVAGYHCNLGQALRRLGRFDEAIQSCERSIVLDPNLFVAHNSLAYAFLGNGQIDSAIDAYRRAIELSPQSAELYCNLSNAVGLKGNFEDARILLYRALQLNPDSPLAHWNLALNLLLCGEFRAGWKEYEWRWQWDGFLSPRRHFSQPTWDGSDLQGKTILLHFEQGFGDTIQFVRYAPLVAARGGKVLIASQPELTRLLRFTEALGAVVAVNDPVPEFDCHCPLGTLPLLFRTELDSIPNKIPYLTVDESLTQTWGQIVKTFHGTTKVGLVWAGNPNVQDDHTRSMNLEDLQPLADLADATFFSLQKGAGAEQVSDSSFGSKLVDLGPQLKDFADTAAVIMSLDLTITTDTAVAHLAGALGRPVWLMLKSVPDWRWLLDRLDSPWYPTMRLFRQKTIGDWKGVVQQVRNEMSGIRPHDLKTARESH
jgi:Flp pilus assembly protein TadD